MALDDSEGQNSPMPTPEELARENIDKQLAACGWTVQLRNAMNFYEGRGVAVAPRSEFPVVDIHQGEGWKMARRCKSK